MRKHRRAHVEYLMQPSRWAWAGEVRAVRKLTHTHTHTHTHTMAGMVGAPAAAAARLAVWAEDVQQCGRL